MADRNHPATAAQSNFMRPNVNECDVSRKLLAQENRMSVATTR